MTQALADRLAQIEETLGIDAYDSKLPNLDITSLQKKLQDLKNQDGLKTDFIMKISSEKLRRLNRTIQLVCSTFFRWTQILNTNGLKLLWN